MVGGEREEGKMLERLLQRQEEEETQRKGTRKRDGEMLVVLTV